MLTEAFPRGEPLSIALFCIRIMRFEIDRKGGGGGMKDEEQIPHYGRANEGGPFSIVTLI